jgi:hypothetical protein
MRDTCKINEFGRHYYPVNNFRVNCFFLALLDQPQGLRLRIAARSIPLWEIARDELWINGCIKIGQARE